MNLYASYAVDKSKMYFLNWTTEKYETAQDNQAVLIVSSTLERTQAKYIFYSTTQNDSLDSLLLVY